MSVYILSGSRTPIGSFLGGLATVPATKLGAVAIESALAKAEVGVTGVQEVFMGMVVQAGAGQAPARQASLAAKIPSSVPATTINKVCGSGLQATILGAQSILTGDNDLVVSGGMENMSMAPFLLPQMRNGIKFGPGEVKDAAQWDGLWDIYSNRPMGSCAEECVAKYNFSREELDAYAIESFKRAQNANKQGWFKNEIASVLIKGRKGDVEVAEDEGPFKADFTKIPNLSPAFDKNGKLTAANSSTLNDGASALVLGGEKYKGQAKFKIVAWAKHAQEPTWFTTAPVGAMKKCLDKAGLKTDQIDLFEINEAFSVVAMAAIKDLGLKSDRVNVFGSGISLGHPIGSTGSRLIVTLMNSLTIRGGKYGMASLCIGGGEALAVIIERV